MHAQLLGAVQSGLLERLNLDPRVIEQVIGGCVTQAGEQHLSAKSQRVPGREGLAGADGHDDDRLADALPFAVG